MQQRQGDDETSALRGPLVEFAPLAGRLGMSAGALGAVAFVGIVIQGVAQGLTFGLMGRWVAMWLFAFTLIAAVMVAVHALGGVSTAQARGERLTSEGVGLVPPRRRRGAPAEGQGEHGPHDPGPHDPDPHDPAPHDPAPHDPDPHDPAPHDPGAT